LPLRSSLCRMPYALKCKVRPSVSCFLLWSVCLCLSLCMQMHVLYVHVFSMYGCIIQMHMYMHHISMLICVSLVGRAKELTREVFVKWLSQCDPTLRRRCQVCWGVSAAQSCIPQRPGADLLTSCSCVAACVHARGPRRRQRPGPPMQHVRCHTRRCHSAPGLCPTLHRRSCRGARARAEVVAQSAMSTDRYRQSAV
jgi:hypothetical protein